MALVSASNAAQQFRAVRIGWSSYK